MSLFKKYPAWMDSDWMKRMNAVSKLKDNEILEKIAFNDPEIVVRNAAKDVLREVKCKNGIHIFQNCTCLICGEGRDEGHDWNRCICLRCKKKRDSFHEWKKGKCKICGKKNEEEIAIENEKKRKRKELHKEEKRKGEELLSAIEHNELEKAKQLISKISNVDAERDLYGNTALMLASKKGFREIVESLVGHGANVNDSEDQDSSFTALMCAAGAGHLEIVQFLVSKGVDVNVEKKIPLGIRVGVKSMFRSALSEALIHNRIDVIKFLISQGADISVREIHDYSLLIRALDDGYEEIASMLIARGAVINEKDASGNTELMLAARKGFSNIVNTLIASGVDFNSRSNDGNTALMEAAEGGHVEIVDTLIAAGADVNAANKYSHTPLMCAAIGKNLDVVKLLVSHGADLKATDFEGRTVAYYALSNHATDVLEYLKTKEFQIKSQTLQGILIISRNKMKQWDVYDLRDKIESQQYELGYNINKAMKLVVVEAGNSLEDMPYLYALIRKNFKDLGGHDLIERCYFYEFQASDGNTGKYVTIFDKSKNLKINKK